jgi:hypothetical protein
LGYIFILKHIVDLIFTAELVNLRDSEDRMRQQHLESSQREKVLVRRLATKEQEMQEYAVRFCGASDI